MEKFNAPEIPKDQPQNAERKETILGSIRNKTGLWMRGAITATLFAGSLFGEAKEGDNNKTESNKKESVISIMNAFNKGVPEMNENKEAFIKSFQEILEQMSVDELLDFVNDPDRMFAIMASSDPDNILIPIPSEKYGDIKDNKELTNARVLEGESLIREAARTFDHPETNDTQDEFFRRELSEKIIRRFTPMNGITTHEEIIKFYPELKNETKQTLDNIARYVKIGIISESTGESDNGIVEDINNYKDATLVVDESGSMGDDISRLANKFVTIPAENRVVWQGFSDRLLGKYIIRDPQHLRTIADKINSIASKRVGIDIKEQTLKSLSDVLLTYSIVPDNLKDEITRVCYVITDEELLNISISKLEEVIKMAEERNVDIKVSLKDHKAGFNGAFRTFDMGAFINTIDFKFPDANKDELFSINIDGGRMHVKPMAVDNNENPQVAVN